MGTSGIKCGTIRVEKSRGNLNCVVANYEIFDFFVFMESAYIFVGQKDKQGIKSLLIMIDSSDVYIRMFRHFF
jgi:hypothetical protein